MSKKGGGKGKSKAVDEELEQLKDTAKKGTLRIAALERELCLSYTLLPFFLSFLISSLVEQKELARQAMKDKDKLQEEIAQHTEEFQEEKADRADIVQNMTRQYKETESYLISKNKELEQQIAKMTDQQGSSFLVSIIRFHTVQLHSIFPTKKQ